MTVDNKTIIREKLINDTLQDRDEDSAVWKTILEKSFDECTKPERSQVNVTGPVVCSPYFYVILNCLHSEMFKNCPLNNQNDGKSCSALSEFVKNCNFIPKHTPYAYN